MRKCTNINRKLGTLDQFVVMQMPQAGNEKTSRRLVRSHWTSASVIWDAPGWDMCSSGITLLYYTI